MIFVSKLSCFLPSRGRHFGSNIAEKPVQVEDNKSESRNYLRKFCLFVLTFEVGLKFVLADKGSLCVRKVQFFLTLFKKPLDPPPPLFEHYVVNFSEGILTKVRKRLSRQLSTK